MNNLVHFCIVYESKKEKLSFILFIFACAIRNTFILKSSTQHLIIFKSLAREDSNLTFRKMRKKKSWCKSFNC